MKSFFTKKNKLIFASLLFFLFAGVLFFGNKYDSYANTEDSMCCTCYNKKNEDVLNYKPTDKESSSEAVCKTVCPNSEQTKYEYKKCEINENGERVKEDSSGKKVVEERYEPGEKACSGKQWVTHPFDCALLTVGKAEGTFLQATEKLFSYVIDANSLRNILTNKAVLDSWKFVRDTLNFAFILVLLFSAFATIFQVEKYSYKKILLTLVLMALLVNFSYPITRVIIDASNVLMYTLVKNLFDDPSGKAISQGLAKNSGLAEIVSFKGIKVESVHTSYLLISIIFIFIFIITLLTIALLLLIRSIVLAILIILSPLGFVGSIFPDTAKFAKDFWDELFKYCLFGPIMIFMLSVAVKMLAEISTYFTGNGTGVALMDEINFPARLAFFMVPIVILWLGMGIAQKMGIAGASAITSRATGFMKKVGWGATAGAGLLGLRAGWGATKMAAKSTGIPGGLKQKWDDIGKKGLFGKYGGSERREMKEAEWAERFKVKDAAKKHRIKNFDEGVEKASKNYESATTTSLEAFLKNPANIAAAKTDKKLAVEYNARLQQLKGDPDRRQEKEAEIRSNGLAQATKDAIKEANKQGLTGDARTAFVQKQIDADINKQITKFWSNLNSNGKSVKTTAVS